MLHVVYERLDVIDAVAGTAGRIGLSDTVIAEQYVLRLYFVSVFMVKKHESSGADDNEYYDDDKRFYRYAEDARSLHSRQYTLRFAPHKFKRRPVVIDADDLCIDPSKRQDGFPYFLVVQITTDGTVFLGPAYPE